jgi:nucleotide-binding universal stress UspA family protein
MKVLIATDGSTFSDAAVHAAAECSWSPDTQLRAITVIEHPVFYGPVMILDRFISEGREVAEQVATKAEAELRKSGRLVSHTVREGAAVTDEIIAEAKEWGADLIFVGTHERTGTSRFLLGSVAERLSSNAPCSIEIVRKKESNM